MENTIVNTKHAKHIKNIVAVVLSAAAASSFSGTAAIYFHPVVSDVVYTANILSLLLLYV